MKYMIEVKEDKVEKLSEHIEKGLHHLGRAMTCVEAMLGQEYNDRDDMRREHEMRHYGRMHDDEMMRYPHHINYRDDDDYDEDELNERRYRKYGRRRDSMGRYR